MSSTRRRLAPITALATAALAVLAPPALAAQPTLGPTSQLIGFNIAVGQLPENLTLAPDGGLDVVLNGAAQVVNVSRTGALTVLASLPAVPGGGTGTPLLKAPFTAGIVRAPNGTIYTLYSTGTAALNGVWQIRPGQPAQRIVALPANSLANGLAFGPFGRNLFITDSALGVVWEAPTAGGTAHVWAQGPALEGTTSFGANGLKVHNGAVWVSNTQNGTILRIPIAWNGSAGPITVAAQGLTSVDDFAFVGCSDTILAALNYADEVALVEPGGGHTIVLTSANGLEGPSSIAVRGNEVYVASAGYYTGTDPNILVTRVWPW
jgi:hypothetical protein